MRVVHIVGAAASTRTTVSSIIRTGNLRDDGTSERLYFVVEAPFGDRHVEERPARAMVTGILSATIPGKEMSSQVERACRPQSSEETRVFDDFERRWLDHERDGKVFRSRDRMFRPLSRHFI